MFRVRVLGGFALDELPVAAAPVLLRRRAEAVMAVLAVCGDLGCTRERLLALLWPESDEASARVGLRDAIYAIRRALGPGAVPSGRLLRFDSVVILSDVLAFTQALSSGRPADAVHLYAGPLLDGFHVDDAAEFERWVDGERARLAREYGEALKQLATDAERNGVWDEAVGWWARAVEHDPVNSRLVLQQVRVLAAIGDRVNAIRVAEGHARRLRDEFDLEPDHEIIATIERIRRGDMPETRGGVLLPALAPPAERLPKAEAPSEPSAAVATPTLVGSPVRNRIETGPRRVPRWLPWGTGVAAALGLAGALWGGRLPEPTAADGGGRRTAVAVLPFRNLSDDSSYAYFAAGLHDELLTQLAKVASLRVVGRTSVRGYGASETPLRRIGEELGVGSIVDASVQVIGNRLRVTVQLLDPVTEAHLWAESYDRTLDDAFAVQSDIAQRIVTAVGATVSTVEASSIAAAPTRNPGAYDFYLQGLAYHRRPGFLRENVLVAQQLYEQAIALDSSFALAHATLASVHVTTYGLRYDRSPTRLELARREAEVALRLAPRLPQAHLATGQRLYVAGTYRDALGELERGLLGAPNDLELWTCIGFVQRSLGQWDRAIAAFEHARRLDPRDANLSHQLGDTYHYLRRYQHAIEAYRTAGALAPDLVQPRLSLAWSYFLWQGELDTLRTVLRSLPADGDPGTGGDPYGDQRLIVLLWERRPDSMLSLLRIMRPAGGIPPRAEAPSRAFLAAEAHRLRGDTAAARIVLDSVVALLDIEERANPNEARVRAGRGVALAALGRRADALREVWWLERFEADRQDRYDSGPAFARARILARLGETDAALEVIERLLAGPSLFSVHELRLNPEFDTLRHNSRYQALVGKYANASTSVQFVGANGSEAIGKSVGR
jgi:TolB-like protein/DNA-binding SARP family transcriptional activator/Flp pilus assembly protein TadD